ncbi:MAG: leucine-rich repeat protein [Oscillospiraceae bacterium]
MLKHLSIEETVPNNLYTEKDGKKLKWQKAWINTENGLIKVWDITSDSIQLIIEGIVSGYNMFSYTLAWLTYNKTMYVPSTYDGITWFWEEFTLDSNISGTIDWGDGTIEAYNSDSTYTHSYYNNEYLSKHYNAQYSGADFKITINFDKNINAIANSLFVFGTSTGQANPYSVITKITFPNCVKYIDILTIDNDNYNYPIDLDVPTSMEIMTCYPSQNQKTITHFEIPNNVKYLGLDKYFCGGFDESYYTTGAFQNCKALTTINIPKSIKMIGSLCFHNCINLQSITGLDGVEVFGYDCFNTCDNLEPFLLPSTTKYILAQSFDMVGNNKYYGYDAHDFYIDQSRTSYLDFNCNAPLDIYEVPDSCIFIGYQAFSMCYWFRILSLPNTIQYLAENFYISGFAVCEIIYRGTTSEWFTIKFTETDAQNYTTIDDFFSTKQITDKDFYKSMSDRMRRILCNDGIIINPYASSHFSDGTEYTGYGDNCFNENGNAIKENFLILNQ